MAEQYSDVIGIGKPFKLILKRGEFAKGDVIAMSRGPVELRVEKVYSYNWWKKLLLRIGFSIKVYKLRKIENGKETATG